MAQARESLIVVSNRLPFSFERDRRGAWQSERGSGGLVSALTPVLRDRGGTWIGWPGTAQSNGLAQAVKTAAAGSGYALEPVMLTEAEVRDFYRGFSNEVVWPLFHDLTPLCNFDPAYGRAYGAVNRKFAAIVRSAVSGHDFIWVHDYHLLTLASELRTGGVRSRVGFFLHIPFPPLDIFMQLPWREQLLHALLDYDLLGFQTPRDRRNFVHCVRTLVRGATVQGKGPVVTAQVGDREVRIGSFPISIDYRSFASGADTPQVSAKVRDLRAHLPHRKLIFGVDRLDYTQGIPHRLRAFENALDRYPELRERMSLIQVVVPSRAGIPEYGDLKTEIEQIVGRINGRFAKPGGWVPVWYVFGSLERADLLAYYRAADAALVTPLKDGMNLVAKEYCACSVDENCVLILSEFAGAAAELRSGALLVNPNDIEGVADAIHNMVTMHAAERRIRMRRLRRIIRERDVFWWVDSFLRAAITKDLSAFPAPEKSVPAPVSEFLPL
jgi:trehalose 6-phosphate synthase